LTNVGTHRALERKSCVGCAYDLGGGQCNASLEDECAAGGFEAWEPKTVFADCGEAGDYRDMYMTGIGFHARQTDGGYVVRWED
jgi:hypothetical protein